MRIISWNYYDAFERKQNVLFDLEPSIAIVSECTSASLKHLRAGFKHIYLPSDKTKGVAIIYREEFALSETEIGAQIVAAVDVSGPRNFRLVAIWPCASGLKTETYVHEIHRAFQTHPNWLQNPVILAGDFNSHTRWDKLVDELSFGALVRDLAAHGIKSVYHLTSGEEHGHESEHTYSHQWKSTLPFHIDYIFASEALLASGYAFRMGGREEYIANSYSDHVPLVLELR